MPGIWHDNPDGSRTYTSDVYPPSPPKPPKPPPRPRGRRAKPPWERKAAERDARRRSEWIARAKLTEREAGIEHMARARELLAQRSAAVPPRWPPHSDLPPYEEPADWLDYQIRDDMIAAGLLTGEPVGPIGDGNELGRTPAWVFESSFHNRHQGEQ